MALPDVADGGGGAAPDPLVPGTAPTSQALTAGTTSSSTITWTEPTGGTAPYSLTVALAHVRGSGASLSGSGLSRTVTGLEDGDEVLVTGTFEDSDGQAIAQTVLVSVAQAASGSLGWVDLADYDLTSVDTASGVTTTSGDIALTVSSAAFVSLVDRTGSGTGTITPTNGTGVVVETVGAGSRSMAITHDWAGDGVDPGLTPVAVEAEYDITTTGTNSNLIVGMASAGSSALTGNVNFCLRMEDAGANLELAPRVYKSAATNDSVGVASAAITTVSVSVMMLPQGFEIGYSLGSLPDDPRNHTYRRAYAWSQAFTSAPSDFSMTDAPRVIFHAFNAAGTYAWTRARFRALGVV
jgi:hypothetical protein